MAPRWLGVAEINTDSVDGRTSIRWVVRSGGKPPDLMPYAYPMLLRVASASATGSRFGVAVLSCEGWLSPSSFVPITRTVYSIPFLNPVIGMVVNGQDAGTRLTACRDVSYSC